MSEDTLCAFLARIVRRRLRQWLREETIGELSDAWLDPRQQLRRMGVPGQQRYGQEVILRPLIARTFWASSHYTLRSEPLAIEGSALLVGAPHTSNWDFVFMLAICWRHGFAPLWLGKHTLFKKPFGPIMRALGGIPVNRAHPGRLVQDVVSHMRTGKHFLVVTPEGTRARRKIWKSGFYRIATDAGLPVVLAYVDSATHTAGLGPTISLTGNVIADMDVVRAFYADKRGIRPDLFTPPMLREESRPAIG